MALINCSECGKQISSTAKTCPNCGSPVEIINSFVSKDVTFPLKQVEKKSNFKMIYFIIGGFVIIIGLLVALLLKQNGSNIDQQSLSNKSEKDTTINQNKIQENPKIEVKPVDSLSLIKADVEKLLIGKKTFGVQWIKDPGTAKISKDGNLLRIDGSQFQNNPTGHSDFVSIQGTLEIINEKKLIFNGTIITDISSCCGRVDRTQQFTFLKTGNRKYWRLQEMNAFCDPYSQGAYYIDIFQ